MSQIKSCRTPDREFPLIPYFECAGVKQAFAQQLCPCIEEGSLLTIEGLL